MSATVVTAVNAAWRDYQRSLNNLTELQEAQIERAFRAGWRGAVEAGAQPLPKREVEQ